MTNPKRTTALAVGLLALGCGGAGAPVDPNAVPDGTHLTAPLEIAEGTMVTIAPGARLTADEGVTITVHGTLKVASAAGRHARVAPATADGTWGGVVVAAGGTLDADGLDLDGAPKALHVLTGALAARYDHGTITHVDTPFDVERGARLDTAHAAVVAAASSSGVNGELHASYLDYEKGDLGGGIVMGDATAVFELTDSKLHGMGASGSDYVVSLAAKLLRVTYTTITGSHCAFHFNDVARFEIDHVTAGADSPTGTSKLNAYGAMLYGSGAGPHTISNSNFVNGQVNLDLQEVNGPITITNTYSTGLNSAADGAWTWAPADVAAAPILDAKPR